MKENKKRWIYWHLLGILGAVLLGSMLASKQVMRADKRQNYRWSEFLMLPHPLTKFERQKYYQNKPKFNVYLINEGWVICNKSQYESTGTHWIAFHMNCDNVPYFDSFGVGYIPKEI